MATTTTTTSQAESEIKAVIYRDQIAATRLIGKILHDDTERLCGNDLENFAQYLTVLAAIKLKIEEIQTDITQENL